jgi:type IV pilus assembly protein PilW
MKPMTAPYRHQRAMTLIELLVAMAIGLIVGLAIFSALGSFEGRKRTSTSVNDIDQSGNLAVFALDKWVRGAGSGFSSGDGMLYGCKILAAKGGAQLLPMAGNPPAPFDALSTGTAGLFKLIPLLIVPGGTSPSISKQSSDALVVMSGSSGTADGGVPFSGNATASSLTFLNTLGFNGGDLVLVTNADVYGGGCLLEQVQSGFVGAAGTTAVPLAGSYAASTISGVALTSFSGAQPSGEGYAASTKLAGVNFGRVDGATPPQFVLLGVGQDNTLFAYDMLKIASDSSYPVAEGVFELHARYGVDTNNDGRIDSWVGATGEFAPSALTAATQTARDSVKKIKAVKLALIMRSQTMEKFPVSNLAASARNCDAAKAKSNQLAYFCDLGATATGTRTLLQNGNCDFSLSVTNPEKIEQCYRYRILETTIPLRNLMSITTVSPN